MTPKSALLLLTFCLAGAGSTGLHSLRITAETPAVTVVPQPRDRHFFNLPSLDYAFQVEARCGKDWRPESLTLSVADSRTSLGSAQLHESSARQVKLHVPAKQIAPVVLRDFCVIDGTAEGSSVEAKPGALPLVRTPRQMTVSAALSAQASLRCSSNDEQKTIYVSQPLDVMLACEVPAPSDGR
jgi:hypothetical protein